MRQVRLVRGLQEVEVKEQGTASMDVELSHAEVEGSWTRDGLRLQPGPKCHLAVQGPVHILTLSALQPQDSGLVAFRAEGVHTSARLIVTGEQERVGSSIPGHTCFISLSGPGRQMGPGGKRKPLCGIIISLPDQKALPNSMCSFPTSCLRVTRELHQITTGCGGHSEGEGDPGV